MFDHKLSFKLDDVRCPFGHATGIKESMTVNQIDKQRIGDRTSDLLVVKCFEISVWVVIEGDKF